MNPLAQGQGDSLKYYNRNILLTRYVNQKVLRCVRCVNQKVIKCDAPLALCNPATSTTLRSQTRKSIKPFTRQDMGLKCQTVLHQS